MKRKLQGKNSKTQKEKFLSLFSGLSGSLSFLGGWQVCHNLCLGIIALLALIGITVVGMPLLFLTQYAVYFWSAAVLLLIPTLILYWKNRKCISKSLILFNAGIVIASVPFASLQAYQTAFWLLGGTLIICAVYMFLRPRLQNKSIKGGFCGKKEIQETGMLLKANSMKKKLYACKKCGLKYREKNWADKCYAWCREHPSCNIEIIRHAVK